MVLTFEKVELHLLMNEIRTRRLDPLYSKVTHLGDGIFVAILSFVLLFVKYRYALLVGVSGVINGLLVQFLKRVVFASELRPIAYLEEMPSLYLLNEIDLPTQFSFPSGHSASIFSLCLCLAIISRSWTIGVFCSVLAFLVSFSRVYINAHFFEDVLAGGLLGVGSTLFIANWISRLEASWVEKSLWPFK